jgi:GT2 family glycosyltransferase
MRDYLIRRAESETSHRSDLHRRVVTLEQSTKHTQSVINLILDSRIWKTLQAGGDLLLHAMRFTPGGRKLRRSATKHVAANDKNQEIQLVCDSLPMEPKDPMSGSIEIRGWALSADGIAGVDISIDNGPLITATYGSSRPDLGVIFPHVPHSINAGYSLMFDTRQIEDGIHRITLTARGKSGKMREVEVPLLVSQAVGYASEYSRWLEAFEVPEPQLVRLKIASFAYLPVISVLVPVFRTNLTILRETIESVLRQSYPHWELCLVDDGSEDEEISELLNQFGRINNRIKIAFQEQGGISAASNRALEMASGEYVALLDHDDVLAPEALFHMVDALQSADRPELLYSDEDHMDETGRRFAPFFKPDWSPDLILSENYVCHLMMFQRDLANQVGGFRSEFDLSQDHDILLRLSRVANRIVHVPRVLYHWRTSLASMSRASHSEEKAFRSSRGVIEAFLLETETPAQVENGMHPGRWRVRYKIPAEARISILIPTAGKTDVLDRNLKSLWKLAGKTPYEVLIIDNSKGDDNRSIVNYVQKLHDRGRPIRHFDQRNEPFNYSRLNNKAASTCTSPYLLFLNDDTEGISEDWMDAMVELAARPEVGAVGAKLLYPGGQIQHAGVTMGLAEICGHSFKGDRGDERHYYDFPDLIRNVSAVTAACVMVRTQVFDEIQGFEEKMFPIAYNDIDFCLRIGAAGYRILYTPHALLYHHEALSKSEKDLHPHPAETLSLKTRWRNVIAKDPFYNPNLTRHRENWSLRWD